MQSRLHVVSLGVADVARARAFYRALGFAACKGTQVNLVYLDAGGVILCLCERALLAFAMGADAGGEPGSFSGIALARNVRSAAEVDALLERATAAGAKLIKAPQATPWGRVACFLDLDGYAWEVAYNPRWSLDEDELLSLEPLA
jgi:uncharacterized protein